MTVYQLNRNELTELKQRHYSQKNKNLSYDEIISINTLVTDEEIYKEYEGTVFTTEDFFCNSNDEKRKEEEENEI